MVVCFTLMEGDHGFLSPQPWSVQVSALLRLASSVHSSLLTLHPRTIQIS